MGPGLPCDCAVNTAVLSQREPARHRETLSSLLLLIEKPIAIYVLTLDTECSPRGSDPAERCWAPPRHTCAFPGLGLQVWPCRGCSKGTSRGWQLPLELGWDQVGTSSLERWETCAPESWSHVGRALFTYSVRKRKCGCPKCLGPVDCSSWIPSVPFVCFPGTSTVKPDGLSGIHTHLLRKT